jgi:beta-lactamase regulating signal transducer with metallopeptidase domain
MTSFLSIGAWLATYAIHSTILLVAALIVTRFIGNERAREVLWKAALLGGFVTSLVPAITGITPIVGRWNVGRADEPAQAPVAAPEAVPSAVPSNTTSAGSSSDPKRASAAADGPRRFAITPQLTAILIAAWILGSLLLIARLVFHHRRILRALRGRHQISDGPLPGMLAELRRKSAVWNPVRLSSSEACPTPIALGRSEICVPARFSTDLEADQQRNALAHELAHLKRRDPLWQMGAGIIESIFFFQPLNIVARRKLRESSEYLADDWAVQQTNAPLALARCLTQISSWVGSVPVPDGMLAMAEGGSPLVSRIERLAEWRRSSGAPARVTVLAAAAFIALVATSAPSFSAVPAGSNEVSAVLTASMPARASSPDSVITFTGPDGSLIDRFNWALSRNVDRAHWIGWETEAARLTDARSRDHGAQPFFSAASSTLHLSFGDENAPRLSYLVGTQPNLRNAGILVRFDRGKAVETQLNAVAFLPVSSTVRFGGDAILWIGSGNNSESLSLIEWLIKGSRNPDMRSELAAAYTIHSKADLVIPGVGELLEYEGSSGVRTEAIQWLARMHGTDPRAIDLLKAQALQGRDGDSRMEAVDGLRLVFAHGSSRARDALLEIADHGRDMRVRSEAMQTLSRNKNTR